MSKVKLITEKKNQLGFGELVSTDVEVPEDVTIIGLARSDFEPATDGSRRVNDDIVPIIHMQSINNLVGKLMTQVEASTPDPEQRKASKDIFRQIAWEWYTNHIENLTRAWRFDKGYEKNDPDN